MSSTKQELIEGSKEVFEQYPKESVILATSDGSYFLPSAKSLAKEHCRRHSLGEPVEITREQLETPESPETPEVTPETPIDPTVQLPEENTLPPAEEDLTVFPEPVMKETTEEVATHDKQVVKGQNKKQTSAQKTGKKK